MNNESKNYLVVLAGRGHITCGLIADAELERVAARMQFSVNQGFEVYIYSFEPSPAGKSLHFPEGTMSLKRHYHLYNAADEYNDKARDVINDLSRHSVEASKQYLTIMQNVFQRELDALNQELPPGSSLIENSHTYHTSEDVKPPEATGT